MWFFRNIGDTKERDTSTIDLSWRVAMTKALLRSPLLWGLTIVRGLRGMALVALVTVLPLYLGNDLHLSPFNRGFHIGMLIAVGLLAKPVAGYMSDRMGRKQILVPGLVWSCAFALLMILWHEGIGLTVTIAFLGLFLYPDQPILTASLFDVVGREVVTTGLGVVAFASFLMAATSPLIAGAIYEGGGFEFALYYIAGLFALAAVVFALLPLSRRIST